MKSLQAKESDIEAIHIFCLYADLRVYDTACSEENDEDVLEEIATRIYSEYLDERESELYVELDPQVCMLFQTKYKNLEGNLNEYLFIEVYAFVLDKLRGYYNMFKGSTAFVQLEDEIRKQERLYEVLVMASLIDN